MNYELVIGLEIHVQLATQSKLFSGASTAFGAAPNSQACAVDLGLPGVLPVLNAEAVRMAVTFGLAIDADIGRRCVFDRKNYFYPDLPKGYQISQFAHPIVGQGHLSYSLPNGERKSVRITRAHLEEDAGKSVHDQFRGESGIDLNRAGTPLLEIVTEPDLRSAEEAVAFLKRLHALVRYLGISDGNMNEGSFRCDVNLSLRKPGSAELGQRTEIKNQNSFRFIERAIAAEMDRQASILDSGGTVSRQTMLYDVERHQTRPMRSKEGSDDYRYFPEPDLLPLVLSEDYIDQVRRTLPELSEAKKMRFQAQFGLPDYDAEYLTEDRVLADYFESAAKAGGDGKLAANWIMGELAAHLNQQELSIDQCPIASSSLGTLIGRVRDGTLSSKTAKALFELLWQRKGNNAAEIDGLIEQHGLKQVSDAGLLDQVVAEVVANNTAQVADYRSSDEVKRKKKLGFFVGQVMKATQGKANPQEINTRLLKALEDP